jgi:hypothetical protein
VYKFMLGTAWVVPSAKLASVPTYGAYKAACITLRTKSQSTVLKSISSSSLAGPGVPSSQRICLHKTTHIVRDGKLFHHRCLTLDANDPMGDPPWRLMHASLLILCLTIERM